MPGRRSAPKSFAQATAQHIQEAFHGALSGSSMLPAPVFDLSLVAQNQQRSPKMLFFQEEIAATGGAQNITLSYAPVLYSEHVYLCVLNAAYGTYQEDGLTWTRTAGTSSLQILAGMNAKPGDIIVVEYAYLESGYGGKAFRELQLPHSFVHDDDGSVAINLPFDFHGFGSVRVASNGVVKLKTGSSHSDYYVYQIWQEGYCLAPYWMDHDTRTDSGSTGAGITRYGIVNVEGKQALVVIWDKMAVFSSSTTSALDSRRSRFQLVLFQNGEVEFNYDTIQTDSGAASSDEGFGYCNLNILESETAKSSTPYVYYGNYAGPYNDWYGPSVGYYTPGRLWVLPASQKRAGLEAAPSDPVYGSNYAKQGIFGLVDTGPNALTATTNCGIPGRLRFSLGNRGPGIQAGTSFTTFSASSNVWNGSYTVVTWDGLPTGVGLIVDIVFTNLGSSIFEYVSMAAFYADGGVVDADTYDTDFLVTSSSNSTAATTYMTSLPIGVGVRATSLPIYLSPFSQVGGHFKARVPVRMGTPELRILQVYEYVY